jgi:hypothetical protein
MLKHLGVGEMVRVVPKGRGKIPVEFTWRGTRHLIRRIEGYRREYHHRQGGVSELRYFHLRTSSGMRLMLAQDVDQGAWHVAGVLMDQGGRS